MEYPKILDIVKNMSLQELKDLDIIIQNRKKEVEIQEYRSFIQKLFRIDINEFTIFNNFTIHENSNYPDHGKYKYCVQSIDEREDSWPRKIILYFDPNNLIRIKYEIDRYYEWTEQDGPNNYGDFQSQNISIDNYCDNIKASDDKRTYMKSEIEQLWKLCNYFNKN
jgi:hypothetical protein